MANHFNPFFHTDFMSMARDVLKLGPPPSKRRESLPMTWLKDRVLRRLSGVQTKELDLLDKARLENMASAEDPSNDLID